MGVRKHDFLGLRFGKLLVLAEAGRYGNGERQYLCRCDCGREKTARVSLLNVGLTTSCGVGKCKKKRSYPANRKPPSTANEPPNDVAPLLQSPTREKQQQKARKKAHARLNKYGGYYAENLTIAGQPPPKMPAEYAARVADIPFARAVA